MSSTDWLLPFLVFVIAVLVLLLLQTRLDVRNRAERRASELLDHWKLEAESEIRRDAVERSRAVIAGKVSEHLAPWLGDFPYNPKDVRFLGTPVDLIVFDGLDEDALEEIVFVEVKTGPSANLTKRERRLRDAVQGGRVRWEELRLD